MDCSIYAQLSSLVLNRNWGKDFRLSIAADRLSQMSLWETKITAMGYISVCDNDAKIILSKLPISFNGSSY